MRKGPRIALPQGRRHASAEDVERRRTLEALLRGLRTALQAPPAVQEGSPDFMDAARETHDEFVAQAMLESCREMVAQVDEALRRLAAGKYGVCVDCAGPIPVARLRALPFAVRCLPCRERFEARGAKRAAARGRPS